MSQMRWFLMNHRSLQMVTTSIEGTLLGRSSAMRCRRIDAGCLSRPIVFGFVNGYQMAVQIETDHLTKNTQHSLPKEFF